MLWLASSYAFGCTVAELFMDDNDEGTRARSTAPQYGLVGAMRRAPRTGVAGAGLAAAAAVEEAPSDAAVAAIWEVCVCVQCVYASMRGMLGVCSEAALPVFHFYVMVHGDRKTSVRA